MKRIVIRLAHPVAMTCHAIPGTGTQMGAYWQLFMSTVRGDAHNLLAGPVNSTRLNRERSDS